MKTPLKISWQVMSLAALGLLVFAAVTALVSSTAKADLPEITVYKSQSCGCCSLWIKYLDSPTKTVEQEDLTQLKEKLGIPEDMQSCHTAMIGKYFIEGHVPREAIEKMIAEQPDIDGIAMPGMPSGAPGMGGTKRGEFIVYAIKDGAATEYARI